MFIKYDNEYSRYFIYDSSLDISYIFVYYRQSMYLKKKYAENYN